MEYFRRLYRFIRYNNAKAITIQAWFLSGWFRFTILHIESRKNKEHWGIEGEETSFEATLEEYRYAKKVSYAVNHICSKTKWESKCLVRALTAQYFLKKKHIPSTLYLGCGYDENKKMVAHAWIRVGSMYVTGGNGEGYAVVDKFRA